MTIQWFPGHMLETKKWLQQSAAKADVVLEILDARVPAASENPWMEKFSRHTPRVKILNKMDLADPEVTDQWLVYFEDHRRIPAIAVNATDRSMAISALEQAISLVPGNRARKKKSWWSVFPIPENPHCSTPWQAERSPEPAMYQLSPDTSSEPA